MESEDFEFHMNTKAPKIPMRIWPFPYRNPFYDFRVDNKLVRKLYTPYITFNDGVLIKIRKDAL